MQTCFASIFSEIAQVADSRLSMKTASSLKSRSSQWSQGLAVLCPCPRKMLAEGIGSFILVFAGTGAVMVNQLSNGAVTHLGVSFVFGAVVAALIYSLGHISGAHFNPAVTLAFWTSGFFPKQDILPYILAQCSGAVVASFLLLLSFTSKSKLASGSRLRDRFDFYSDVCHFWVGVRPPCADWLCGAGDWLNCRAGSGLYGANYGS